MSFNFQIPYPGGPTATQPAGKDLQVKAVKLTNADFSTGSTTSLKAVLPADASIVGFRLWVKTQLSGGGITAATFAVGLLQGGQTTYFFGGNASAFGTSGTYSMIGATNNIMQDYGIPLGQDIQLTVTGTATTGNPTAGEMYLLVEYIR